MIGFWTYFDNKRMFSYLDRYKEGKRLQMSLQRQHFPLSYLKTLSIGPAEIRTRDLPLSRSALYQLSKPGLG